MLHPFNWNDVNSTALICDHPNTFNILSKALMNLFGSSLALDREKGRGLSFIKSINVTSISLMVPTFCCFLCLTSYWRSLPTFSSCWFPSCCSNNCKRCCTTYYNHCISAVNTSIPITPHLALSTTILATLAANQCSLDTASPLSWLLPRPLPLWGGSQGWVADSLEISPLCTLATILNTMLTYIRVLPRAIF